MHLKGLLYGLFLSAILWLLIFAAGTRIWNVIQELTYDSQHRQTYHEERRFK